MKRNGQVARQLIKNEAGSVPINTTIRTTRSGETAIRETYPDGSVKDISASRVKEYVPNTNPNAPPNTLQKAKFPDALPGSKGYKRSPTTEEIERLGNIK